MYMYDIHLSKQLLEAGYIFCTIRKQLGVQDPSFSYKMYYQNHPITQWAKYSYENYEYLYKYMCFVNDEHKHRNNTNINHKTFSVCDLLYREYKINPFVFLNKGFLYPYQAMPFIYQMSADQYSEAYRKYYYFHKRYFMPRISWKRRDIPFWFSNEYFINKELHKKVDSLDDFIFNYIRF